MREYVLVWCVAAGLTWLLTPLARVFALRVGAMAAVRDRDVHTAPTPRLGGLALYGGVLASALVAHQLPSLRHVFAYSDLRAMLVAGGMVVVLGALDDRFHLGALVKLAGQTVAASVMVLLGLQLVTLTIPGVGVVVLGPLGTVLTILLVVTVINAVNFIDGLDGLLAGAALISSLALFAFSYILASGRDTLGVAQERISAPALIAILLAGVCAGFLPHNFHPARIFMGDSGSMLVGLMLSSAVISLVGQFNYSTLPARAEFPALLPLLLPLGVLAIPALDLILAVLRRTRAGRSPFAPDKLHLHHRLLEIGHSHRRAVLIMYLWTIILSFSLVATSLVGARIAIVGAGVMSLLAIAFGTRRKFEGGILPPLDLPAVADPATPPTAP